MKLTTGCRRTLALGCALSAWAGVACGGGSIVPDGETTDAPPDGDGADAGDDVGAEETDASETAPGDDGATSDASGDDGGEPDGDAGPGPVFPVRPSDDGRHLVDASGRAFPMHGEAAWSLLAQLTLEQAEVYLADRRGRGVNTLLVNLLEHYFADDPPRNAYGEEPFTTPGDLRTPNEAYFARADAVLAAAAEAGMLVLLFPAYMGYGGGAEGWFVEMSARTTAECGAYGRWLGDRYAGLANVVWMAGGDYNPPAGSAGEACGLAIAEGLAGRIPGARGSYHGARGSHSFDQAAFAALVDYDAVYTGECPAAACLAAHGHGVPAYLIEGYYENEHGMEPADLRRQSWTAVLVCGAGQIFGGTPVWNFGSGWEAALDSVGSRDQARLRAFLDEVAWQRLEPAPDLVTSGGGTVDGTDYVAAGRDADGRLAVLYVAASGAGARSFTVDLSGFAGPARARFFDPTTAAWSVAEGSPFAAGGTRSVAVPGLNGAGDGDWVLVLDVP
ncbi:MAG: DUF4038 domain-containing protein [Deltaproteobacteria bacterium]|nr:DUF4038 domain-containing protein [Deltaproteobacteria bacterium]